MKLQPRLLAAVAFVVILAAAAHLSGLRQNLNVDYLRSVFLAHPVQGALVFIALFCVGNLAHIPGLLFLLTAVLALGKLNGGLLVYVAANVSCLVTFLVFRWIGGNALQELKSPLANKLLARLHLHPVRVVTVLRMLMQTLPSLNVALALTGLKLRHYVLGNALGLPVPIVLYCLFFDALAQGFKSL